MLIQKTFVASIVGSAVALTLGAAAPTNQPMEAASPHHWQVETIGSVTKSTVTVSGVPTKSPVTLPINALTVRAGWYPASSSILAQGEKVRLLQGDTNHPLLVVWPSAHGTLQIKGTTMSLTHDETSIALQGTSPTLFGMSKAVAGQKVEAFGVRQGKIVAVKALAARPLRADGTVTQTGQEALTIRTRQYGSLSLPWSSLPAPVQSWLKEIRTGEHLNVWLDPSNRRVLMAMPGHAHRRMLHMLDTSAMGQLSSVKGNQITLTNRLGKHTLTLPNVPITVKWSGHPHATLSQVPPGSRVLVHFNHHQQKLMVCVMKH